MMRRSSRLFLQRGSLSVEAAIVLPLFIFIVFSGIELSRGMLIRASLNDTLAEAARAIKIAGSTGDYQTIIEDLINNNPGSLIDSSLVKVTNTDFFDCPAQLADGSQCTQTQREDIAPIARFEVTYDLDTISPLLGTLKFNSSVIVKYEKI